MTSALRKLLLRVLLMVAACALTIGLHGVALADGGKGGGANGGNGGDGGDGAAGYAGAAGGNGTIHGGGGGGAAGDVVGGAGGLGGPGVSGSGAGGVGGTGGVNNQNGAAAGNGGDGAAGATGASDGGGSGGGGGGGGAGLRYTIDVGDLRATAGKDTVLGGAGGNGGKGDHGGAGGKGGTGGSGIVMASGASVTVNVSSVTGGAGGKGGDGADDSVPSHGVSGSGGNGGVGVIVSGGGSITVLRGTVTGGKGGDGGNSPHGRAFNGGAGGAGLSISGTGSITVATGVSIIGGKGGAAGTGNGTPTAGSGGAGIKASAGASVTVAGSVTGGMDGSNSTRASAIDFGGGGNTLTLQNGYAFTGNVTSDGTGAAGDTLALGGTVNGTFALGDLGTVFQGFRAFEKTGTSTWTVTGTSSFSNPTTITAGTLALSNASLASSPLTVSAGGTLSVLGTSTVSSLDVYGIVAMADATALLKSGGVTFRSGSTYLVQVDTASAAKIQSTSGSVELSGGTVKVIGIPSYGPSYTIASGAAIAGAFASAEMANGAAFILPTLHYDVTGQVYLTFARASFASVARTANQLEIAAAIDAQGDGGAIATALMSMTADEARAAYDALSGSSYASTETAVVEQSFTSQNLMIDRLLSHASNHLWGKVFGTLQSGGGGNATPYSSRTSGVMGGADGVFGDWRLGAMLGYGRGAFATSTTSADSAQYYAGIYASTNLGDLQLRTGAGYTRAQVAATRKVAVGTLNDTLSSTYGVNLEQAFAEIGYKLNLGGTRIEPFGGLAKVMSQTPAVTETGGSTALNVGAASDNITLATLGLHGTADFTLGTTAATLQTTLAWQHAFGAAPQTGMTFQSGGTFNAAGAPVAADSAIVRADLGLTIAPNAVLSLSYAGEFAAGSISQTANAEFNVQF